MKMYGFQDGSRVGHGVTTMRSNTLQNLQHQEWLIGLNNRLIDMNERLIEQRGHDQKERELLLQIVQSTEDRCQPVVQETTVQKAAIPLMSGKDFSSEEDPKPVLSRLFLRTQPKAVPLSLTLRRELVSGADFRNGQAAPRLSGLFL